jgi:hypothetical protein
VAILAATEGNSASATRPTTSSRSMSTITADGVSAAVFSRVSRHLR